MSDQTRVISPGENEKECIKMKKREEPRGIDVRRRRNKVRKKRRRGRSGTKEGNDK